MELKPETFFIGVVDFFSIMLPGAVLTFMAKDKVEGILFGPIFPRYTGEAAGWALFLFSSYLLGHFIFLIGSKLDDWVYAKIRRATNGLDGRSPTDDKKNPWPLTKWLARKLFGKTPDLAVHQVRGIKKNRPPDVGGKPVVNAFQWSKAKLTIQCPAALIEVHRLEADSKFFRSLAVLLPLIAVWAFVKAGPSEKTWIVMLGCLLLCSLSLWRYIERRFKATQQAYWYVITLEHCPPAEGKASS